MCILNALCHIIINKWRCIKSDASVIRGDSLGEYICTGFFLFPFLASSDIKANKQGMNTNRHNWRNEKCQHNHNNKMCTFVHYLLIVGGSGFVSCLSNKESVKQYTATPTVLKKKKKKKKPLTFQGIQKFYWVIFQKHFWCSINKAQESDSCHVIFFRTFQWRVSWTSHSNTASHDPDTWPRYTRYPVSIIYRFTPEAQETTYFFFKIHTDYLLT